MRKQFDIKFRPQIESGEYKVVVPYDDKDCPARIICWDFNCNKLVVIVGYSALIYNSAGHHLGTSIRRPDLFIVTPEPEPLTKLEKAVFDMLVERTNEATISEQQARKYAPIFLEIVKDEIYSHESLVEYAEKAKAEGKAEALKDLPRWSKNAFTRGCAAIDISGLTEADYIRREGKLLSISDIEKLPGFKEE